MPDAISLSFDPGANRNGHGAQADDFTSLHEAAQNGMLEVTLEHQAGLWEQQPVVKIGVPRTQELLKTKRAGGVP